MRVLNGRPMLQRALQEDGTGVEVAGKYVRQQPRCVKLPIELNHPMANCAAADACRSRCEPLLAARFADVTVGEMDCTVEKQTCAAEGVRGYPTLLLFIDGKNVEKYSDKRSELEMS